MSSGADAEHRPPALRWQAVLAVLFVFILAGLEAGIVLRARAALIDPRTADEVRTGLVVRALPPPEMAFDFRPPPAFDRRAPEELILAMLDPGIAAIDLGLGPNLDGLMPEDLIAGMLGPSEPPFDRRGVPRFEHTTPVALMMALMPDIRATLAIAPVPAMPEPPPALGEAHMEIEEPWLGSWRKQNPDRPQRVHFAEHVVSRCLPNTLVKVLGEIAEKFGEVKVISGYRSPDYNRRVGGASRSMHLECKAIDFYVSGRAAGLLDFLERRKDVGGYARYPFGSFHIDTGPRRTW